MPEWLADEDPEWNFPPPKTRPPRESQKAGTEILISDLHPDVSQVFSSNRFASELERRIAGTYALFLDEGLSIQINRHSVKSVLPKVGQGGEEIRPGRRSFDVDGVDVLVVAGVAPRNDRRPRGTYVFCNGRMILESDRTAATGWGGGVIPQWHTSTAISWATSASEATMSTPYRGRPLSRASSRIGCLSGGATRDGAASTPCH